MAESQQITTQANNQSAEDRLRKVVTFVLALRESGLRDEQIRAVFAAVGNAEGHQITQTEAQLLEQALVAAGPPKSNFPTGVVIAAAVGLAVGAGAGIAIALAMRGRPPMAAPPAPVE